MSDPEMTQVPVRALGRMHDRIAELERVVRLVAAVQPAPGHGYDLDAMDGAIIAARKALAAGVEGKTNG